jgi:hypothetical protein
MIRNLRVLAATAVGVLCTVCIVSGRELWAIPLCLLLIPWDIFGLWIAELVETWQIGKANRKKETP